ncbi:DEAD/DEAH box helicase [Thalassolituus maritimus]|uniref:DEAD/DEAH box helicase n=2 Tax=Thalassolituus TaxID=187492 RepID=A0ABQ0A092_9GAMM
MSDTLTLNTELTFDDLHLAEPIARAVKDKGYTKPSPIQAKAIPVVLKGGDLLASAQTGTGKTAAFTLPVLQQLLDKPRASGNRCKALVLTPTRELAAQILENAEMYSKHTKIRSTVVFGGVKINPQMQKLRSGTEVLVATPGRLLDLHSQNAIKFDELDILVLDEADRMLDMGFIHDIKRVLKILPPKRQNLLFSATFSDEIRQLAHGLLDNPAEVSVAKENTTNTQIEHKLHPVDKSAKTRLLSHLTRTENWEQALVFSRTKHGANKLVRMLEKDGIKAAAIHGNKSQNQRTKALADFKDGKITLLIATDIAARGIDIHQLPQVVNFDLPNVPADYVHRIGRTGRAGMTGHAISLVSADEIDQLQDIERLIQMHIEREEIKGFKPQNPLPESRKILPPKNKKPKKPKKPKPQVDGSEGKRSENNNKTRTATGKKDPGQKDASKKSSGNNSRPRKRAADNKPASGNKSNHAAPSQDSQAPAKKPQIKLRRSQRAKASEL